MNKKLMERSPLYQELIEAIGRVLMEGRSKALQAINKALVRTNWEIGRYIVEYEQKGRGNWSVG